MAAALVLAYAGIQRLRRPEPTPIPDYNPAELAGVRANLDAPYVSTEYDIVRAMLNLAGATAQDLVVDLGSGDGRIPILAAREKGARGLGVDLDPARIREARSNALQAGVSERVAFRQGDLFNQPLGDATLLTLYLLPEINLQLRPRILQQMRPGTRVVSNSFDMGDWRPDRRVQVQGTNIFLWTVPAQAGGRWRMSVAGGGIGELALQQRFQDLQGTLSLNGRSVPLRDVQLQGAQVAFTADLGQGARRFEGRIDGGGMAGNGWQAVRVAGP